MGGGAFLWSAGGGGTVSGYWDQASTKQSGSSGGVGISATVNIVYDATDSKYTDSKGLADATQHVEIFDNVEFLKYFDLATAGAKTWPKLKASITIGENTFSFTSQPTVSGSDADATVDVNWVSIKLQALVYKKRGEQSPRFYASNFQLLSFCSIYKKHLTFPQFMPIIIEK